MGYEVATDMWPGPEGAGSGGACLTCGACRAEETALQRYDCRACMRKVGLCIGYDYQEGVSRCTNIERLEELGTTDSEASLVARMRFLAQAPEVYSALIAPFRSRQRFVTQSAAVRMERLWEAVLSVASGCAQREDGERYEPEEWAKTLAAVTAVEPARLDNLCCVHVQEETHSFAGMASTVQRQVPIIELSINTRRSLQASA